MFRRCISTLVLLGFVASQLAAVPHAHGGYSPEQQREHDARPHVHVGSSAHSHEHNPSHGGHSHDQPTDKQSLSDDEQLPYGGGSSYAKHDADAIYLPSGASSPVAVKDQRTVSSAGPIPAANSDSDAISFLAELRHASVPIHLRNGHSSGAKLFLTLRNLRI